MLVGFCCSTERQRLNPGQQARSVWWVHALTSALRTRLSCAERSRTAAMRGSVHGSNMSVHRSVRHAMLQAQQEARRRIVCPLHYCLVPL